MTFTTVVTSWVYGAIVGAIFGATFVRTKVGIAFTTFGGIIGGGFGANSLGRFGPQLFDVYLFPTILGAIILSIFLTIVLGANQAKITYKGEEV